MDTINNSLFNDWINTLKDPNEYRKLQEIGGHKIYHLEGNALVHSEMVFLEAREMFGGTDNWWMTKVAGLHDIGKIYSSVKHGENDWVYPNHAKVGAENLNKFISEDSILFETYQWYILNHIKPLFWTENNITTTAPVSKHCTISNLAKLAICDIKGSRCVPEAIESQLQRIEFLKVVINCA